MLLCRMAIKVIRRLRFSWHKKNHVKTTTYCALQVRCSLVKISLYTLAMQATLTLTRTSASSARKEENLFMQATLRQKKKQQIRTKPSKWAEIITYNLPKTYEYSKITSVQTAAFHPLVGCAEMCAKFNKRERL